MIMHKKNFLSDMTCVELRHVCKVCGLLVSGSRDGLVSKWKLFIEALSTFDRGNANEYIEGFDSESF